uniref:Malectin-like domain-containing protein n=1 Tax=Salix viminalis TaxID=40686 RepID=A0A6N2MZQ2_SALVM
MYRTWNQSVSSESTGNTPYLPGVKIKYTVETPAYSAPYYALNGPEPNVNKNYNLTWLFQLMLVFIISLDSTFVRLGRRSKLKMISIFNIHQQPNSRV